MLRCKDLEVIARSTAVHEESSPGQTVRATEQKQIPVVPTESHQIDCGYNAPSTLLIECRASRNGHVYASSKQPRIRVLANRLYGLQPQRLLILRAGQHFEGGKGADLSLVVLIDQVLETLLRLRLTPLSFPLHHLRWFNWLHLVWVNILYGPRGWVSLTFLLRRLLEQLWDHD